MPKCASDKLQSWHAQRPDCVYVDAQPWRLVSGFWWKSAPLGHIVGGFGWIFRSDTTEQQPCFITIEKLISTL